MKYILLVILWGAYGAIHSVFASSRIKSLFKEYLPGLFPYYRIIYSGFAVILLIPILVYQSALPQKFLFEQSVLLITAGLTLATLGLMVVLISFRYYDLREFLGIRQMKGEEITDSLQRSGPLNYVRHPLYSGSILGVSGYFLFAPSITNLVMGLCVIVYFMIGIQFEEKKLIREFGDSYIKYKKEVPSIIPRLKIFR